MSDLENYVERLHESAPPLTLMPTQEEYNAWFSHYSDHTREALNDPDIPFYLIDLNDAVMNYLTLVELVRRHPEMRPKAEEIVEDVVRNAMGEHGGMVGGAGYIAERLDASPAEAQRIMFHDIFTALQRT